MGCLTVEGTVGAAENAIDLFAELRLDIGMRAEDVRRPRKAARLWHFSH